MRRLRPRLFTLTATAAVLAGCGGPLCDSPELPTCDVRDPVCQAQVQEAVACMRGMAASELPPVEVIDTVQLEAFLREGGNPAMMRVLNWERPLQMLRLFDPEADLYETNVAAGVSSIVAIYTYLDDRVYIVDRGEPLDSIDAVAILVHELVHAAQDEESDLQALFNNTTTHEEVMLTRSLAEGEATFYTYETLFWLTGYPPERVDWQSVYEERIELARAAIDANESPYLTVYGLLPYLIGSRYASGLWVSGGDEAVRPALSEGLESTAWLLVDPFIAGSPTPPERLAVSPCAPPPPPAGYEQVETDEMGAPLIYAFLRHWGMTHAEAWSMALRWRRDDLVLYQGPGGEAALAWRMVYGDTQAPRWVSQQISFGSDAFRLGYAEDTVTILTADDPTALEAWTWATTGAVVCDPP